MTDGVTEKANKSQLLDSGLSTKVNILANPYVVMLKCDGDESSDFKSCDAMLPRKASRVNCIGARTENRHRWARRVS